MNSAGVTVSDSPTPANLFDEFEEAFQNCLAPLTKEDPLNGINQEELTVNAETNGQRFLELAHRMDAAFLQKRFLLSVQKPELLLMEENHEMRIEMSRKDELIKKQTERVADWQNTLLNLVNIINRVGVAPSHGAGRTPTGHMPPMANLPGQQQQAQPMGVVTPSGSVTIVGGGGVATHGAPNIPHGLASSVSIGHPSMGQMGGGHPGGALGQGAGVYSTTMGGPIAPPSSMGGSQGGAGSMGVGMLHSGSSGPSPMGGAMSQQGGGLQGPLAYLEKTTTNIGMPDPRR